MLTDKYTKNSSKNVTPSSSWSSTSSSSSSKSLIPKNETPSQVKKSTKLKKNAVIETHCNKQKNRTCSKVNNFYKESC